MCKLVNLCEGDSHAFGPVDFQGDMWRLCHCFCELYVQVCAGVKTDPC